MHSSGASRWSARWNACWRASLPRLIAVPVVVVLSNVFLPAGDTWAHLASTVLPEYIENTLWLMLWVGAGVTLVGVATAWLTTMCRFPGRGFFEWALILPLAVPAYVMAYAYTDFFQFTGPVQSALRAWFGWRAREYWFPEVRSLGGAALIFSFVFYPYVYLLARAAFLAQGGGADRGRAQPRLRAVAELPAPRAAARAARHRRGRRARADGDARRFRHGRLLSRCRLSPRASTAPGSLSAIASPPASSPPRCWGSSRWYSSGSG